MANEWEKCDPHDETFWNRFNDDNNEAEKGRKETLRGMGVKN